MKKLAILGAAWALPLFAFAQLDSIQEAAEGITIIINNVLVPLVFAIAFLVFIFGIFQYFILGGGDDEKRESGKKLILWGVIGFFVMVAVWGLVNILLGTFNLNTEPPFLPAAPGPEPLR